MASSLETSTTLETDILPSLLNNDTSIISNTTDTSVLDISVLDASKENISEASSSFSIDDLTDMFSKCEYITKCKSTKKKDETSLSFLVKRKLSQSECIKLGTGLEAYFRDFITSFDHITNIKKKNQKGSKERDHLFENKEEKIIYYAELKGNLNLDTEKSKSTSGKCLKIVDELKAEYPEHTIRWCLLGLRYIDIDEMSGIIKNKYGNIIDNLYGVNEYFKMLDIDNNFTKEIYVEFINRLADKMFNNF